MWRMCGHAWSVYIHMESYVGARNLPPASFYLIYWRRVSTSNSELWLCRTSQIVPDRWSLASLSCAGQSPGSPRMQMGSVDSTLDPLWVQQSAFHCWAVSIAHRLLLKGTNLTYDWPYTVALLTVNLTGTRPRISKTSGAFLWALLWRLN